MRSEILGLSIEQLRGMTPEQLEKQLAELDATPATLDDLATNFLRSRGAKASRGGFHNTSGYTPRRGRILRIRRP